MPSNLTSLSISSTAGLIETYEQFGGEGHVWNKALALPAHLNRGDGPWASIEYVVLDPAIRGKRNTVGTHTQTTDELYYILSGTGILTTNGQEMPIAAGWLALAPRGTTHSLSNPSVSEELTLLLVELQSSTWRRPPVLLHLTALMRPGASMAPVRVAHTVIEPLIATLDMQAFFAGAWGTLSVLELPPGATVEDFCIETADNLLFFAGRISAWVTGQNSTRAEAIEIEATDEDYRCLCVPPGVACRLQHQASDQRPALLLSLTVSRQHGQVAHG